MSQPPRAELVRRAFDALRRRAYSEAVSAFDEQAEWQNTDAFPGPRRCVGRNEIIAFWRALAEDFDPRAAGQTIERVVEDEDVLVVAVRSTGRGRQSDVPVDVRWAAVVELRDGLIARVDVHGDWSRALDAAGLAP